MKITPPSDTLWSLEHFFDRIICINRASRTDRWQHCQEQCEKFALRKVERFNACEIHNDNGLLTWTSCNASHREVLKMACEVERTLILEDDFDIRYADFHPMWEMMAKFVPSNWDLLYLGGHYGNDAIMRINPCVIRCDRMLGASSYGVTKSHARRLHDIFSKNETAQSDCCLSALSCRYNHYILEPRLMVQYEGFSDLCQQVINPAISMTDPDHEKRA